MSIDTWKAEFYQIPATDVRWRDAVTHSITKWKGLLPDNLAKHQVVWSGNCISDPGDWLSIDGDTCALCEHYQDLDDCSECPISKIRNGGRCDETTESEIDPPYWHFIRTGNPLPMIKILEALVNE